MGHEESRAPALGLVVGVDPGGAGRDAGVLDAGFAELHGRIEHDAGWRRPTGGKLIGEFQAGDGSQIISDDGHSELTVTLRWRSYPVRRTPDR